MTTAWYNYPLSPNGNWNPAGGEYGIDLAVPYGTNITSVSNGTVVNSSYQPWGGQVGIQTNVNGQTVTEYIQHLDTIAANIIPGASVTVGELLGTSGGQTSGGNHPASSQYSSGPHIEFGFNAPWVSPSGANFNPTSYLQSVQNGQQNMNILPSSLTPGTATSGGTGIPLSSATSSASTSNWWQSLAQYLLSPDLLIRAGLVIVGIILLVAGIHGLVNRPSVVVEEK